MEEIGIAALVGAGVGAIIGAIWAVYYVVRLIAEWRIFTKAGEKGWKSLIPFLNVYTEYKLTSNMKWFVIYLVSTLIAAILQRYTGDSSIIKALSSIVNILVTIVTIYRWYCLAKAFGKGTGFTIGLTIFNPIFIIILGMGDSRYLGPVTNEQ